MVLEKGGVAVVTGGATGIGFALADALARRGLNLVIASRRSEALQSARETLAPWGTRIVTTVCDVSDRAQVRKLATLAEDEFGGADLLVANAGFTTVGRLLDHEDDDWDAVIDTNFRGVTHCVQAFYPAMAKRGAGTILMTSSQTALSPDWILNHGPYVACKAAVLALGLELRVEAAAFGVAVSVLIPGATSSEMRVRSVPPDTPHGIGINPVLPQVDMTLMSADAVASRALAGLEANAPIIATHGDMLPIVREYCERLVDVYERTDEAFEKDC